MSGTDSQDVEIELGELEEVLSYSAEVVSVSEEIKEVFEEEFGNSEEIKDGFEDYFEKMDMALAGVVDEEARSDVSNGLLNGVTSLSREGEEEIRKQDKEVARLLRHLKRKHFNEITRRIKRIYQGDDWWSNIETDHKFRSNRAAFTHHITIDNREKFKFSSSPYASSTLSRHLLKQVEEAPEILGKDVLEQIDKQILYEINEISSDLINRIEDYEDEFETEENQASTDANISE